MSQFLTRLHALPLLVLLMGLSALAMVLPAIFAAATEDFFSMRAFLQGGGLVLTFAVMLGVVTSNYEPRQQGLSHLFALFATFVFLPVVLAVPVKLAEPDTRFFNAYFEMVSSVTTTGATLFPDVSRLAPAVHLWRALVAWFGGLYMLIMAVAILAPMNLGGFDVLSSAVGAGRRNAVGDEFWATDGGRRIVKYTVELLPLYIGLTAFLWLLIVIQGQAPMHALVHAMSILSTSGITASGQGLTGEGGGLAVELTVFLFLFLALSRQPFVTDRSSRQFSQVISDPELRMGLMVVAMLSLLLFLRHWIGAFGVNSEENFWAAIRGLWGSVFTILSFLTTTGFESIAWEDARDWSGLGTPGIILMGLSLIGGGVATTAGGVKLLRVYALYAHGRRELDKLVHPSSVAGMGAVARRLRREGAFLAWVFFMLFALSLCLVVLAFSLAGLSMETAIALAIAALSTTGPVAPVAVSTPFSYDLLSDAAKMIFAAAMVLGRLETLVIIALFNPEFWRR